MCHACARKIRKDFKLHNFIYLSMQKEKQAVIEVSVDSSRLKFLILITTVSLPDQSPQARKGHKTSDNNSIAVKFSDNISEIWSSMTLSEITTILVLGDNSCLACTKIKRR